MSQKTGKRSRRPTEEREQPQVSKPSKANKDVEAILENLQDDGLTNGKNGLNGNSGMSETSSEADNSRSNSILKDDSKEGHISQNSEELKKNNVEEPEIVINGNEKENKKETLETVAKENEETETNGTNEILDAEDPSMDEVMPELIFEENSEPESGKSSPAVPSRPTTRRSQLRNIPTPKTPKLDQGALPEKSETPDVDLNGTFESCEAASTKAEAGNDSTRMEYLVDSSEPSNFLSNLSKDKSSYVETLRNLSTRRTMRGVDEYRRRALQNKSDLNLSYPQRNSVERVNMGVKRKSEDEVEGGKRYKLDTSGFLSKFTSPLTSLKRSFSRSEIVSSTPKLTGYKDEKLDLEGQEKVVDQEGPGERRWCTIM